MENVVAIPTWDKTVPFHDPKLRMPTRPTANARAESSKTSNSKAQRRRGAAHEDFGSSFDKSSPPRKEKSRLKWKGPPVIVDVSSDSSDEMDLLSSSHGSDTEGFYVKENKKKKQDKSTDDNGTLSQLKYKQASDALKGLKFKKNKPLGDGGTTVDMISSQPIVLKENRNMDASGTAKPSSPSRPFHTAQTTVRRARSPRQRVPSKRTPSPNSRWPQSNAPKLSRDNSTSENTRPKPRPFGARTASVRQQPQALPDDLVPLGKKPPRSPARRMKVSGAQRFPSIDPSPPQPSKTTDPAKKCTPPSVEKLKRAEFPALSPAHSPVRSLRPTEFPSLDLLRLEEPQAMKNKVSGKRSVSEKMAKAKPAEFPMLSPPSGSKTKSKREDKKKKRNSVRCVVSSEESDNDEASSSLKAQPFPMSTQVLGSIGSSSVAGPSSLGKRSPSGSEDTRKNKKRKDVDSDILLIANLTYDEEDTITMPPTDPRTLCPYCDALLPPSPTPLLKRLLASTEKKSHREPRPDNPLGRNAPFAVFIAVCQRHRFESQILPKAELKGWPKSIDWTELGKRVRRMKGALRAVVDDAGADEYEGSLADEAAKHPRSRCVFWREVIAEVKQKGSRAVAGVRGQFASFEKTQPGYYGELGSVIIHQTLYDLFPPASIDPDLVAPLTANEFVQRILVPEVGVRLIMEDMGLDQGNAEDAVRILRESANYGVAMFPADDGEEGEGGRNEEKIGVADSIMMERARKRRKELEADEQDEEERKEEEQRKMAEEREVEKQRQALKKRRKGEPKGGKDKESDVQPLAQTPKARPRPRPVSKNSSVASAFTNDVDMSFRVPNADEGDTDVEVTETTHTQVKRPRQLSRTATDLGQPTHEDVTPRKRKGERAPSAVDIDLCLSSGESDGDWDTGRMTRGRKKHGDKAASVAADDDDLVEVDPPPSSRTPAARRSGSRAHSEAADTPQPRNRPGRLEASSSQMDLSQEIPPLQRARERKARSMASSASAEASGSHAWLLSDSSQSSMDSVSYT